MAIAPLACELTSRAFAVEQFSSRDGASPASIAKKLHGMVRRFI